LFQSLGYGNGLGVGFALGLSWFFTLIMTFDARLLVMGYCEDSPTPKQFKMKWIIRVAVAIAVYVALVWFFLTLLSVMEQMSK
jgi:presenilin-like A22 family membrane protease